MRINVGCELAFEFSQTMPMIVTLNVHFSRSPDLERPDHLMTTPSVPIEGYRDSFGNWCSRLVAPAGRFTLGTDAIVRDPGLSDAVDLNALQHQVQDLPTETLLFLLGSRYCETDRLSGRLASYRPARGGSTPRRPTCRWLHGQGFMAKSRVSGMRAQTDVSPTAPVAASIRNATVLPERSAT